MESIAPEPQKSPRQLEIERLSRLKSAPFYINSTNPPSGGGVLLGDQIHFWCEHYQLLTPYCVDNIKAASYELRVGAKYAVGGKRYTLQPGETLTIPKFEVAVVQILETINLPPFLIGRWNIRTRWAYSGLIWVGGPQVDPGYRGLLMCPLWNLSNEEFRIDWGEQIAVIDFVATSQVTARSQQFFYDWRKRSRVTFEEYKPEVLRSALVTEVEESIFSLKKDSSQFQTDTTTAVSSIRRELESTSSQISTRIDGITAAMFTALGVVIAAITIFATKNDGVPHFWDPTIFFLAWATTVLSVLAFIKAGDKSSRGKLLQGLVLALAIAVIFLQLGYAWHSVRLLQEEIASLRTPQRSANPVDSVPAILKQSQAVETNDPKRLTKPHPSRPHPNARLRLKAHHRHPSGLDLSPTP